MTTPLKYWIEIDDNTYDRWWIYTAFNTRVMGPFFDEDKALKKAKQLEIESRAQTNLNHP